MPARMATAATGTLTRKTDVHENHSRSRPPNSGPSPMPIAAMPAQIPIALPRSSRGKTFVMIESVAGMMSAAPTPIAARIAISWLALSATSTARLALPKIASPASSARFRPKRSPSVPMVRSRPAKTSRYESTIHWSVEFEASKCSRRLGRATLRIVLSSPMITRLSESTARVFQRRAYTAGSIVWVSVSIESPSVVVGGTGMHRDCRPAPRATSVRHPDLAPLNCGRDPPRSRALAIAKRSLDRGRSRPARAGDNRRGAPRTWAPLRGSKSRGAPNPCDPDRPSRPAVPQLPAGRGAFSLVEPLTRKRRSSGVSPPQSAEVSRCAPERIGRACLRWQACVVATVCSPPCVLALIADRRRRSDRARAAAKPATAPSRRRAGRATSPGRRSSPRTRRSSGA